MIDLESLIGRLGNVPHFKGMPEAALKEIVFSGQMLNYPAGSTIFVEGEPASGIHVLFMGLVHLCKIGLQGQETIIAVIKPVIMFNEVTVIDGGPNPLTAIAVQNCITWRVDHERYQALMERYPQVGTGLLRVMAERNRLMLARYEDLLSRPVLARAAKMLLDMSQKGQEPINRYRHPNQEIAALAATVPEAISRSIKTLREMGVIQATRSQITVQSPERLAKLAQIEPLMFETWF